MVDQDELSQTVPFGFPAWSEGQGSALLASEVLTYIVARALQKLTATWSLDLSYCAAAKRR